MTCMRAALCHAARTLFKPAGVARRSSVARWAQNHGQCARHSSLAAGPRGALIVLEGTDRSGKSTQCARLVAALNAAGVTAESLACPDRTTAIGLMLDAYLKGTPEGDADDAVVHLLFCANRWERRSKMLHKLQAGTTLVMDRYAYSGVAFTSAKHVPELSLEWCKAPESGLPAPDAVLMLRLSPTAAAARGGFGQERYEKTDFQQQVAHQFELLREPWWTDIDASHSHDVVAGHVLSAAMAAVQRAREGQPLRTLW